MTKIYLILLFFALPVGAWAAPSCIDQSNPPKYLGKPLSSYFQVQEKKLKIGKSNSQVMVFNYRGPNSLSNKDQEQLYYNTLYHYDSLLIKKRCPSSVERVYFLFPKTSMTISKKDMVRIRNQRVHPAWEAHALLRSQVVHEKI